MKTRQTKEEVGRQHQGMDRPGVRQVPEGSGEQGKMERKKKKKTGCKNICGAPTTLAVKALMMMMIMYYQSQALNTGTSIQQGDLSYSAGLHRNHELATANTGKNRERFWKKCR